jgi:hypothetical protein
MLAPHFVTSASAAAATAAASQPQKSASAYETAFSIKPIQTPAPAPIPTQALASTSAVPVPSSENVSYKKSFVDLIIGEYSSVLMEEGDENIKISFVDKKQAIAFQKRCEYLFPSLKIELNNTEDATTYVTLNKHVFNQLCAEIKNKLCEPYVELLEKTQNERKGEGWYSFYLSYFINNDNDEEKRKNILCKFIIEKQGDYLLTADEVSCLSSKSIKDVIDTLPNDMDSQDKLNFLLQELAPNQQRNEHKH